MLMSPSPGYIYTPVVINCATFKNTNRRHELILFRGNVESHWELAEKYQSQGTGNYKRTILIKTPKTHSCTTKCIVLEKREGKKSIECYSVKKHLDSIVCYPCFYIQYFLNFSNRLNVNALIHLCPLHKASYCSFCQKATHKFDKAMVTTAGQPKD